MFGRKMPAPVIGGDHRPQAALIGVGLRDRRIETTEPAIIGMLALGAMVFKNAHSLQAALS
jgi:hypothetical protein